MSICFPKVHKMPASPERTKAYLDRCYEKLPFAVSGEKAKQQVVERAEEFENDLLTQVADDLASAKRRLI